VAGGDDLAPPVSGGQRASDATGEPPPDAAPVDGAIKSAFGVRIARLGDRRARR
jgi:hypothetical protein